MYLQRGTLRYTTASMNLCVPGPADCILVWTIRELDPSNHDIRRGYIFVGSPHLQPSFWCRQTISISIIIYPLSALARPNCLSTTKPIYIHLHLHLLHLQQSTHNGPSFTTTAAATICHCIASHLHLRSKPPGSFAPNVERTTNAPVSCFGPSQQYRHTFCASTHGRGFQVRDPRKH